MLLQGLILMVAGMGTVFLFLVVLIYAILASSRVVQRIEAKLNAAKPKQEQPDNSEEMARVAAAIAVGRTLLNAK
mgnify:CR=1 FL=1